MRTHAKRDARLRAGLIAVMTTLRNITFFILGHVADQTVRENEVLSALVDFLDDSVARLSELDGYSAPPVVTALEQYQSPPIPRKPPTRRGRNPRAVRVPKARRTSK